MGNLTCMFSVEHLILNISQLKGERPPANYQQRSVKIVPIMCKGQGIPAGSDQCAFEVAIRKIH